MKSYSSTIKYNFKCTICWFLTNLYTIQLPLQSKCKIFLLSPLRVIKVLSRSHHCQSPLPRHLRICKSTTHSGFLGWKQRRVLVTTVQFAQRKRGQDPCATPLPRPPAAPSYQRRSEGSRRLGRQDARDKVALAVSYVVASETASWPWKMAGRGLGLGVSSTPNSWEQIDLEETVARRQGSWISLNSGSESFHLFYRDGLFQGLHSRRAFSNLPHLDETSSPRRKNISKKLDGSPFPYFFDLSVAAYQYCYPRLGPWDHPLPSSLFHLELAFVLGVRSGWKFNLTQAKLFVSKMILLDVVLIAGISTSSAVSSLRNSI